MNAPALFAMTTPCNAFTFYISNADTATGMSMSCFALLAKMLFATAAKTYKSTYLHLYLHLSNDK